MEEWQIILNQAKKLLASGNSWISLGGNVHYCVVEASEKRIVIERLSGGEEAVIGRFAIMRAIEKLKANGSIYKTDLIDSVVRQTALVYLHPNIYYNSTTNTITWNKNERYSDIAVLISEASDDELIKIQQLVNKRKNQTKFRQNIFKLYNSTCAISNTFVKEVLEAAHIVSHSKSGINKNNNGILLRSDLHILFDKNLIKINPYSLEITVSNSLQSTDYYQYHMLKLKLPISSKFLEIKWNDIHFCENS